MPPRLLVVEGNTAELRAKQITAGTLHVQVGKTFQLDEIAVAHRFMEENKAGGKIVVLT